MYMKNLPVKLLYLVQTHNVASMLIFGRDVEQPFFNVESTLPYRRRNFTVILTLNGRGKSSVKNIPYNVCRKTYYVSYTYIRRKQSSDDFEQGCHWLNI